MAIEDAACLGIVFGKKHFAGEVSSALKLYEHTRKHRATRVQAASARAAENIHERIGASLSILLLYLLPIMLTISARLFKQYR